MSKSCEELNVEVTLEQSTRIRKEMSIDPHDVAVWVPRFGSKRRRRRLAACAGLALVLALVIAIVVAMRPDEKSSALAASTGGDDFAPVQPPTPTLPTALPVAPPSAPTAEGTSEPPSAQAPAPTSEPTRPAPSATPSGPPTVTTFCAIADVPYTPQEVREIRSLIQDLPEECEFLIHLGDIKSGGADCAEDRYEDFFDLMWESPVVPFVVPGDNEWNDCPDGNYDQAWAYFEEWYVSPPLDSFWSHEHNLNVIRHPQHPENFHFVHKKTLFMGLNLVGGQIIDQDEWDGRMAYLAEHTIDTIMQLVVDGKDAEAVVLFGHALPTRNHNDYFDTVLAFLSDVLNDEVPVLYLHGDDHRWERQSRFGPNTMRIMIEGGSKVPVPIFYSDPEGEGLEARNTFSYDRRLR